MIPNTSASVMLAVATVASAQSTLTCKATPVSVRLPPVLTSSSTNWQAPPVGWDFGNWFQTNSSNPNTFQRNLQYSTLPIDPANPQGQRTDLSSFQINNGDNTVYTSYGTDTPTPIPGVYFYQGTGILQQANDSLEIIAWGNDCRGDQYRVSYSTFTAFSQTPASLDVLSRTPLGPDATTLGKLQAAFLALNNADFSALVKAIGPAIHDSGRDGQPPILECDAECQTNKDLLPLLGGGAK